MINPTSPSCKHSLSIVLCRSSSNHCYRFGPNTFPAFNSVIFSVEVQVAYIANTLIKPIIDGYADVIEVKKSAEDNSVQTLDRVLNNEVFSSGCSNWYINKSGRNSAAWPGLASTFWKETYFTRWDDFKMEGGSKMWLLRRAWRGIRCCSRTLMSITALVGIVSWLLAPEPLWLCDVEKLGTALFSNLS